MATLMTRLLDASDIAPGLLFPALEQVADDAEVGPHVTLDGEVCNGRPVMI